MQITKRQHYIPRTVLIMFSIDQRFIYEERVFDIDNFYKTNIINSMCSKNIYEDDLLRTNAIENYFASTIDSKLGQFHKEIILLIEQSKYFEAKRCFIKYAMNIVKCYFRSGALLEEYNTAFKSQKGQIILNILVDTPNRYLYGLSKTIINDYHFSILTNDDFGFILGDSYLSVIALGIKSRFVNASNRQIGFKDTMVLLPISPKYCLAFFHGKKPPYITKNSINKLSNNECLDINLAIFHSSYNKIVSNNCKNFSLISSNDFSDINRTSPITVITKFESGKTIGYVNKKEAFFYKTDYEIMNILTSLRVKPDELNIGPYDLCYCGSGKKHKECCFEKTKILKNVYKTFAENDVSNAVIKYNSVIEKSITIPPIEYKEILDALNLDKPNN